MDLDTQGINAIVGDATAISASAPYEGLPDSLAELERIRERAIRTDTMAADLGVRILPRPGTAFRYRGKHLYYMTELRTVVEVSAAAQVMLTALLLGDTYQEAEARLSTLGTPPNRDELRANLLACKRLGYFEPTPPAFVLHKDMDRYVDILLAHQPMKIMLFMAQTCNLRCTYCYGIEGNYSDRGSLMSEDVARRSIDYLLNNGPDRSHFYVYFFGGEPLLNFKVLRKTVEYARGRAKELGKTIEFGLTTNGTLLTQEACEFLVREDFQITVSMDGTPQGHDVNRPTKGGGGSSAHVLRGLDRLRSFPLRKNQLKVRATMSHQNHDPIEIAAYFGSLGIKKFGIGSTIERAGNPTPTDLKDEDFEDLDRSFDHALSDVVRSLYDGTTLPRYNPFFKGVIALKRGKSRPGIGCGVCRNDQGIGTDGLIYPCHRYVGLQNYVIGDVVHGLDREKTRSVYRQFFEMWDRHCRSCWARYACSGACAWQHSHDDGTIRDPIGAQCNSIRRSLQRTAWLTTHLARQHPTVLESLGEGPVGVAGDESSHSCVHPA